MAVLLYVVAEKQSVTGFWNQRPKPPFPLGKRHVLEIFAIAVKDIENAKPWFSPAQEKIVELRLSVFVETDNLSIENY